MSKEREQAIRTRAYLIWEQQGRPHGKELVHWLQAEAEMAAEKIVGVTDTGKVVKSPARRARSKVK
jgi:hypothetical protein